MDISRQLNGARLERIPADADIQIHPVALHLVRAADAPYLAADLASLTPLVADYLELVEPIIMVRARRRYLIVGGYRCWTIVQQLRGSGQSIRAIVLHGRVGDDVVLAITTYDLMVHRLVTSLDRHGAHHIDRIARALSPGYHRPAAGRPLTRDHQPSIINGFFRTPLRTPSLAQLMRVDPTTLRRARVEAPHD